MLRSNRNSSGNSPTKLDASRIMPPTPSSTARDDSRRKVMYGPRQKRVLVSHRKRSMRIEENSTEKSGLPLSLPSQLPTPKSTSRTVPAPLDLSSPRRPSMRRGGDPVRRGSNGIKRRTSKALPPIRPSGLPRPAVRPATPTAIASPAWNYQAAPAAMQSTSTAQMEATSSRGGIMPPIRPALGPMPSPPQTRSDSNPILSPIPRQVPQTPPWFGKELPVVAPPATVQRRPALRHSPSTSVKSTASVSLYDPTPAWEKLESEIVMYGDDFPASAVSTTAPLWTGRTLDSEPLSSGPVTPTEDANRVWSDLRHLLGDPSLYPPTPMYVPKFGPSLAHALERALPPLPKSISNSSLLHDDVKDALRSLHPLEDEDDIEAVDDWEDLDYFAQPVAPTSAPARIERGAGWSAIRPLAPRRRSLRHAASVRREHSLHAMRPSLRRITESDSATSVTDQRRIPCDDQNCVDVHATRRV